MAGPIARPILQLRDYRAPLDIARVTRRAVETLRTRAVGIGVAAVLLVAAPTLAINALNRVFPRDGAAWVALYYLVTLGSALCGAFFQGFVALAASEQAYGQTSSIQARLGRSAAMAAPAALAGLLYWLGVSPALFLLVVPGLMLATAWSVALPALAVERLGPVQALGRSAKLTRDNRWRIFALAAGVWVGGATVWIVVEGIMSASGFGSPASRSPTFVYAISPILAAVREVCLAALLSSIYVELAGHSAAVASARVAEVFA